MNEKGTQEAIKTAGLKHGTGADAYIVLAPQPSQDPNDPLNWSKLSNFMIISIGVILHVAVSVSPTIRPSDLTEQTPMIVPAIVTIADDFNVSIQKIALLFGYQTLVIGGTGYVAK